MLSKQKDGLKLNVCTRTKYVFPPSITLFFNKLAIDVHNSINLQLLMFTNLVYMVSGAVVKGMYGETLDFQCQYKQM